MPHRSKDPEQQFAAVDELLGRWLQGRNTLLSKYTELAVATEEGLTDLELKSIQTTLGGLIVDYISAGHFEIFDELISEAQLYADGGRKLTARLIPQISDTTEFILAYEEKYGSGQEYPETLQRDLSALGEILETRFVLEDQLIAGLHSRHRARLGKTDPVPV